MSATISSLKPFEKWFNATAFKSEEVRPVDIEMFWYNHKTKSIHRNDRNLSVAESKSQLLRDRSRANTVVEDLVHHHVQQGHQIIVFCSSKARCRNASEKFAALLSRMRTSNSRSSWTPNQLVIDKAVDNLKELNKGNEWDLIGHVRQGVAYHHAGMEGVGRVRQPIF